MVITLLTINWSIPPPQISSVNTFHTKLRDFSLVCNFRAAKVKRTRLIESRMSSYDLWRNTIDSEARSPIILLITWNPSNYMKCKEMIVQLIFKYIHKLSYLFDSTLALIQDWSCGGQVNPVSNKMPPHPSPALLSNFKLIESAGVSHFTVIQNHNSVTLWELNVREDSVGTVPQQESTHSLLNLHYIRLCYCGLVLGASLNVDVGWVSSCYPDFSAPSKISQMSQM